MANDKLGFWCSCGKWLTIARYYGDLRMVAEPSEIEAFLNDHLAECGHPGDKIGPLPFKLATEGEVP